MANILMINVPYSGHTNPTLSLATELVKRGHDVYYINSNEFKNKIEETGAKFIPYVNFTDNLSFQQKKMRCFKAAYDTAMGLKQKFDLLIYEMFFYPGKRIAEKLNIPCVRQFSQPAWNDKILDHIPWPFAFSIKVIELQMMSRKNKRLMDLTDTNMIDSVLHDKVDLNIVYVSKVFQNKSETFSSDYVFTVPPMKRLEAKIDIPYEQMKTPVVYISLGSIWSNKSFYKKCLKAFGNKNVSVILTIGDNNPKELGEIPSNIFVYQLVPQLEVLAHTDLFITHCGMNSVNEAIVYGVPMLCLPMVNDQISNAKQIAELGNGIKRNIITLNTKELYSVSMKILGSREIKNKAVEVREKLQDDIRFSDVVELIEKFL